MISASDLKCVDRDKFRGLESTHSTYRELLEALAYSTPKPYEPWSKLHKGSYIGDEKGDYYRAYEGGY